MMPIHKLFSTAENNSFTCWYLEPVLNTWFDTKTNYANLTDQDRIVVLANPWRVDDTLLHHLDRGGVCIIDGLWEQSLRNFSDLAQYKQQILELSSGDPGPSNFQTVSVPNWFWYNECLWYQNLGYDQYLPRFKSVRGHTFFMPIRKRRSWRDRLVAHLQPCLDSAIWSYVDANRTLPGYPMDRMDDQRYFNPDWYDDTWFSVVAESALGSNGPWFLTEKTCKPLAYYHPFVVFGQIGILERLRQQGFETFPEIFDESYDFESNTGKRLQLICDQVKSFTPYSVDQPSIREKLQHNHNLFFNKTLVTESIRSQLIEPMLEFLGNKVG
jgi:hypothetical protein